MRRTVPLLVLAMVTSACTAAADPTAISPVGVSSTTEPTTRASTTTDAPAPTTTLPIDECFDRAEPTSTAFDGTDLVEASVAVSQAVFDCAHAVALAAHNDPQAIEGAALAMNGNGPVLIVDGPLEPQTRDELLRLGPRRLELFGVPPAVVEGLEVETVVKPTVGVRPARLEWFGERGATVWLAGSRQLAAIAWTAARATGGSSIQLDPAGLLSAPSNVIDTVENASGISTIGVDDGVAAWHLQVIRTGTELPGGGYSVLEGKRLVALYGNPTTPFLGVLGEQDPEAGLERLRTEIMPGYGVDGRLPVPTFEIIATIASARAGGDNDYSDEMAVSSLLPWVEFAAENGVYVVLDLQPGRTDFLTQARYYTELLRYPHVGLALDPEWRLGPNQVHLRQIGSVDAAEINRVSEWLADLVATNGLPPKLFLVHQFKFSMITNRDQIVTRPELEFVIQMDGQGPLPTKYDTYSAITAGTGDRDWQWGWKNFFDEDSPMATPEQVLDVEPDVVFVSFQ